jgi:hypothetical protein
MQSNLTESRLAELWDLARSNDAPRDLLSANELLVLEQYRTIHGSLAFQHLSAPQNLIEKVKGMMPQTNRKFSIAQIFHPQPLLGFARGTVSQFKFVSEDVEVRIQLEDIPNGWRIWGRTSEPGWTVWSGQMSSTCNEKGEFELDVKTSSIEPLSLQNETMTILLPMIIDEPGDGNT